MLANEGFDNKSRLSAFDTATVMLVPSYSVLYKQIYVCSEHDQLLDIHARLNYGNQ